MIIGYNACCRIAGALFGLEEKMAYTGLMDMILSIIKIRQVVKTALIFIRFMM
jgi:hypothetical protein